MIVKGEKIVFPGGGTHFHYGADKYIASIANVSELALSYEDRRKANSASFFFFSFFLNFFLVMMNLLMNGTGRC